jgi:hypothetical protein
MYPTQTPDQNPVLNSDNWGRPYVMAATTVFDALSRSALRPQPDGYQPKATMDPGQKNQVYEVPDFGSGTNFKVGILDGRYIDEVFDNDVGASFHYLSFMQRAGTFEEKPLTTIALAASWAPSEVPPVEFETQDYYRDGRSLSINFRSFMPKAYDRLLGGIISEDWDAVAPYVTAQKDASGNSVVKYLPLYADAPARDAGATVIDPLVGYAFQTPAIVYSLMFTNSFMNPNQTYTNSMRVWVEGGPEAIALPDSEKLFFYEPESHVMWATRLSTDSDQIDGKQIDGTIGARMVRHANFLLADAYYMVTMADPAGTAGRYPALDPITHMPQFLDGPEGTGQPTTTPVVSDPAKLARLRSFVGVMNVERQAMWWLGFGPLH